MKDYKKILEGVVDIINSAEKSDIGFANICTYIGENCPELKESEDERIRKDIVEAVELHKDFTQKRKEYIYAWLEKQGKQKKSTKEKLMALSDGKQHLGWIDDADKVIESEQKPADKIEPKFKVGDFLVNDYCMGRVVEITNDAYLLDTEQGIPFSCHSTRLWDITKDANDGDVLVDSCADFENPLIFILKKFEHKDFGLAKLSDYSSYCFLTMSNKQDFKEGSYHHIHNIRPATKEQRDTLFAKMKEARYEWNAEKKELKKIEQKVAWTEEDEKILEIITSVLQVNFEPTERFSGYEEYMNVDLINWLKSLKDRYTWKPSDEQIKVLNEVLNFAANHESPHWNDYIFGTLNNLIRQLKKLRE